MYASRLLVVAQIAIVILFGVCTKEEFVEDNFSDIYVMFTGIEIMMFFVSNDNTDVETHLIF